MNQNTKYIEARNISLFELLKKWKIAPVKEMNNQAWYISPFRNESTASFKLDLNINKWYDHGEGIGGNTLDFVIRLFSCSAKQALEKINMEEVFSFQPSEVLVDHRESKMEILSVDEIKNSNLKSYLKFRGLMEVDYASFLKEIRYEINGKKWYSIGFKNIYDGYELRNKYIKNSIGKKGISFLKRGSKSVYIFEGFLDFLSYQKLYRKITDDIIVLNSISHCKEAILLMRNYKIIELFLDNDNAGKRATNDFFTFCSSVIDNSYLYEEYNDVNDCLMELVKKQQE
jgi:hypothetical protein